VRCFIEIFAVGADRKGAVAALEDILAKIAPLSAGADRRDAR
jgi:hypothetical protein